MNTAQKHQGSSANEQRQILRHPVLLSASGEFAAGDTAFDGFLVNISTGGFLIETETVLSVGKEVTLDLLDAVGLRARVAWANDPLFGCEFDEPIAPAIVNRSRLKSEPEVQDATDHPGIGTAVERLRLAKGWTRAELADAAGVSRPSVWGWETGRTEPRQDAIRRLAAAFGCSAAELRSNTSERIDELDQEMTQKEGAEPYGTALVDDILSMGQRRLAERLEMPRSRIRLYFEISGPE